MPVRPTSLLKNDPTETTMTHAPDEPCPFAELHQPIGMVFGNCCWLRGKCAEYQLRALGEEPLADRLYGDMSPSDARSFGYELEASAEILAGKFAGAAKQTKKPHCDCVRDKERKEWVLSTGSTFDEALKDIETAARWYQKVGELGFAVHAWL